MDILAGDLVHRNILGLVYGSASRMRELGQQDCIPSHLEHHTESVARPGEVKYRLGFTYVNTVCDQIVLSHFARSTDDLGPKESFVHRQLRTTTDVICPDSLAFLHGGLHLQVTHHLFPRLPRHNLRAASFLVKEFATAEGLEYAEFGFIHGNGEVLSVLKNVAEQAKVIGVVADANAKKGHFH